MSSSVVWLLGHAHTCACIGGILRLYLGESYSWLLWPKVSVDDLLVWSRRGSHMACSHSPTHREDRWHSTAQGFPVTKEVHPRRNKNWSRTYIHHVPETLCCVWTTTYRTLILIQIPPKHIKYCDRDILKLGYVGNTNVVLDRTLNINNPGWMPQQY